MKMSRRGFLKSVVAGASVLVIPNALSIGKIRTSHQADTSSIGLKSGYSYREDQYWIRTEAIKKDGSAYNDLLQIREYGLRKTTQQEKVERIEKYLDMILERAGVEDRPTQNQIIESFRHSNGNYLLDMVN